MRVKTYRKFKCILHGSFRKHFAEIQRVHRLFTAAGIQVLAPDPSEVTAVHDGFSFLASDKAHDPRMVELVYLNHLRRLGPSGFSYFVNPDGYIGKSTSYELGIAQICNIPCFFLEQPKDLPVYLHANSVLSPELLAEWVHTKQSLPEHRIHADDRSIHQLWQQLMVAGSVVAVGGIIEYHALKKNREREVLLVRTHKWGGRYSIVGGKVRRNERLSDGLRRQVKEETGLAAVVGRHLCTLDQIENSGYYRSGVQHIFIDNVVRVQSKKVILNAEAQEFVWMPVQQALRELDIEPNAKHTLEVYRDLIVV